METGTVSNTKALRRIAAGQYGLATRRQLAESIPSRTISTWAKSGRLVALQSGVFRVAGVPDSWEQRCLAAVLAGGEGCVAARGAAGYLWGYLPRGAVEVAVERARLPRLKGVSVHRCRDLAKFAAAARSGIAVTAPALTLLDLAAGNPVEVLTKAIDIAVVNAHVTVPELMEAVDLVARPGRCGVRTLRDALHGYAVATSQTDSVLEARFLRLTHQGGLPGPEPQHEIRQHGQLVARVDFYFASGRVIVELDGLAAHRTASALQRDLERQNRLVGLGYTVLRFTWDDVMNRADYVLATIGRALGTEMAK